MLKKLQRRFILITMSLVGMTVLVLFITILMLSYRSQIDRVEEALDVALQSSLSQMENAPHGAAPNEEAPPPSEPTLRPNRGLPYVYTIVVSVDKNGSVLSRSNSDTPLDDQTLSQAIVAALSQKRESGALRDLGLYFKKHSSPTGTRIAFTTEDHITKSVSSTALATGLACLGALVIFYFISYFLSKIAIHPIKEAWEKQQRFVADASHDLKTPLTVILANMAILKKQKGDCSAAQWQWIESTEREAERMRELTESMLTLAAAEQKPTKKDLTHLSASELLEGTVLQYEALAFESGITLTADVAPSVTVKGVADFFVRLSYILLDNAIKYSKKGGTVTVSLKKTARGPLLSFKNEGDPIDPATLPHIFERFYRADSSRSTHGYGLGLSIAKSLAEAQNAKISVKSDAESGTVFEVLFR